MTRITRSLARTNALLFALVLAGCSSLPDAKIRYYLPKSNVSFAVVRTIACTDTKNLVTSYAVTPKVTHSADLQNPHEINLKALRGTFTDSEISVDLYPDGRLKSVGATSVGQGQAILTTSITILGAVVGLHGHDEDYTNVCKIIKENSGDSPLSITYAGPVNLDKVGTSQILVPAPGSGAIAGELSREIGHVCAIVEGKKVGRIDPVDYDKKDDDEVITLLSPGSAKINVSAGGADACDDEEIWSGQLAAAQAGSPYDIPIPGPRMFGKRTLSVGVTESGALSSIGFTGTASLGQALSVANTAYEASQGQSTAEKAAAVKAEADLIAQQQRLVACLADKPSCK